jgi:formylglycine-generating enzyme required for sulfatase activity
LSASLPPRGLGGWISAPPGHVDAAFRQFLDSQAAIHRGATRDTTFPLREVKLTPAPAVKAAHAPDGMVAIEPARLKNVTTEYRVRETGFYTAMEYRTTKASHGWFQIEQITRDVDLAAYALDVTPVTNAQFADFLKQSGYRTPHPENFLKHWVGGAPPAGLNDHPVVYVDLDDARAYAAWAGKRLPTEEEWQYAAEGEERRRYPWGNALRTGVCNAGETGTTTPVRAFPAGRSPFGCYDMCGNTWEWTESERTDGRTRFAMVRGGSYYEARGSHWYMDGGPQPGNFSAKVLLMWPGLDRCATVGFRCAVSL